MSGINLYGMFFPDNENGFGEFDQDWGEEDLDNDGKTFTYEEVSKSLHKNPPTNLPIDPPTRKFKLTGRGKKEFTDLKFSGLSLKTVDNKRVCPICSSYKHRKNEYLRDEYYDVVPIFLVQRVNSKTKEKFMGCPNFPRCKFTLNLRVDKWKNFDYDDELRPF